MEAILVLPVLLLISLGVAQFAHIWLCRTMVHYAAYCGARATLTAPSNKEAEWARNAAEVVCAPIAFLNPDSSDDAKNLSFPGVTSSMLDSHGILAGSGCVKREDVLQVTVSNPDEWHRKVQVTMNVPLLFPFAGPVIGKIMKLYDNGSFSPQKTTPDSTSPVMSFPEEEKRGIARIKLNETVYIVKPFRSTWSD